MREQERQVYRVYYERQGEFPVVPLCTVKRLLLQAGNQQEIRLPAVCLFPPGYIEYLEKVLNSNRHLPLFSYPGMEERQRIEIQDIYSIAGFQLAGLKAEKVRCFSEVCWEGQRDENACIRLSVTEDFQRLCGRRNVIWLL